MNCKIVIRELFKVDKNKLETYILEGDPKLKYNGYIVILRVLSEYPIKKFVRFILALPRLGYGIRAIRLSSCNSTGTQNKFDKSLSEFKYYPKTPNSIAARL